MEFHFDVELYKSDAHPDSLLAEVHAPTEHLARRKILDDMLDRRIFIKSVKIIEVKEEK